LRHATSSTPIAPIPDRSRCAKPYATTDCTLRNTRSQLNPKTTPTSRQLRRLAQAARNTSKARVAIRLLPGSAHGTASTFTPQRSQ